MTHGDGGYVSFSGLENIGVWLTQRARLLFIALI